MKRSRLPLANPMTCLSLLTIVLFSAAGFAESFSLRGRTVDPEEKPVSGATIPLLRKPGGHTQQTLTGHDGRFQLEVKAAGKYDLTVNAVTFQPLSKSFTLLSAGSSIELQLTPVITHSESVIVTADVNALDVLSPDPAEKVFRPSKICSMPTPAALVAGVSSPDTRLRLLQKRH